LKDCGVTPADARRRQQLFRRPAIFDLLLDGWLTDALVAWSKGTGDDRHVFGYVGQTRVIVGG